MRYELCFMMT